MKSIKIVPIKNKTLVSYVPHGINHNMFYPITAPEEYNKMMAFRNKIITNKDIRFILLFNSRNIRRKMPSDIILSYKTFCDSIGREKADKCCLILHTQPIDENGTNLFEVIQAIAPDENIIFTPTPIIVEELNYLYNIADVTINISSNEGWGLSITESIMAGTPVIINVTGGLQDQVRFSDDDNNWIDFNTGFGSNHAGTHIKHGVWAECVFPATRSIQGSVPTPYIFDDRVDFEEVATAIEHWYNTPKDNRKQFGLSGREWLLSDEAKMSAEKLGENIINSIDTLLEVWQYRDKYELIDCSYVHNTLPSGVILKSNKKSK